MTPPTPRHEDPLIDEVRARRKALLDSCNNDLHELLRRIDQLQRQHPEKMVSRRKQATRS